MALFAQLKRSLREAMQSAAAPSASALTTLTQLEISREFSRLQSDLRQAMPGNPAGYGYKVYSQADEDGIVAYLCGRLNIGPGIFTEIGCGDGRENNTHLLLLKGWRGLWLDADPANIESIRAALPETARLRLIEAFVTRENVLDLVRPEVSRLGSPDLLSVDVDGNDLPITLAAVSELRPKVVIAEYNAKFPYPINMAIGYDSRHAWQGDDYHGASLAAWVESMSPGYVLVCCNLAGTNAFFVRNDYARQLEIYSPEQLYQPARFHLTALQVGHRPTLSFLARALSEKATGVSE